MQHRSKRFAPANDQPNGRADSYCPNCGTLVTAGNDFCPNCGYKLDTATTTTAPVKPAPTRESQPQATKPRKPRQPWSKKKKLTWIGVGVAAVAVIGLGVWGSQYYSRQATLNRTISDIKAGKNLTNDFTSASSSLKLTKQNLLPVSRYYGDHKKDLNELKQDLLVNGRGSNDKFAFVQRGHRLLVFPNYQIVVTPVYPKVATNHTGTVIKLDNQTVATANSDDFTKTLNPLVPGEYHLQSTGKVGGKQLTNSGDYHITSSKTYDLELTTISCNLETIPASAVYLNGKKVGNADANGTYMLTDEPWSSDMAVYAQYTSSEGVATTPTVHLKKSDNDLSVQLAYTDLMDHSDASDFFDSVASMVSSIADGSDEDDATDLDSNPLSDYYQNGSSNQDYAQIVKMAQGYDSDDAIDSVSMDNTVKGIKPGPNQTSLVTYKTKYTFYLTDEDYEHVQTFQYTATLKPTDGDVSQDYQIVKVSGGQKLDDYHTDD